MLSSSSTLREQSDRHLRESPVSRFFVCFVSTSAALTPPHTQGGATRSDRRGGAFLGGDGVRDFVHECVKESPNSHFMLQWKAFSHRCFSSSPSFLFITLLLFCPFSPPLLPFSLPLPSFNLFPSILVSSSFSFVPLLSKHEWYWPFFLSCSYFWDSLEINPSPVSVP